uniref:Uncharacterized protein n=1 Tax=Spongospora subterranea TaxID=70186 RepID=A0A0H5QPF9_9EUKA|eukprot:CRZ03256.1 hypothetical protein [Spongospora subterranea]
MFPAIQQKLDLSSEILVNCSLHLLNHSPWRRVSSTRCRSPPASSSKPAVPASCRFFRRRRLHHTRSSPAMLIALIELHLMNRNRTSEIFGFFSSIFELADFRFLDNSTCFIIPSDFLEFTFLPLSSAVVVLDDSDTNLGDLLVPSAGGVFPANVGGDGRRKTVLSGEMLFRFFLMNSVAVVALVLNLFVVNLEDLLLTDG